MNAPQNVPGSTVGTCGSSRSHVTGRGKGPLRLLGQGPLAAPGPRAGHSFSQGRDTGSWTDTSSSPAPLKAVPLLSWEWRLSTGVYASPQAEKARGPARPPLGPPGWAAAPGLCRSPSRSDPLHPHCGPARQGCVTPISQTGSLRQRARLGAPEVGVGLGLHCAHGPQPHLHCRVRAEGVPCPGSLWGPQVALSLQHSGASGSVNSASLSHSCL